MAESSPREAALQGLAKMKLMADMGIRQAVLPPQARPAIPTLRKLGFHGDETSVIHEAAAVAPGLLRACCSASSMWAANAATISPGADTEDGRVHITPANLPSQFHRSIEPSGTAATLKRIFSDERYFRHHEPLPPNFYCADEGAANHMRLCANHGDAGVEIFVFGRSTHSEVPRPVNFPARQSLEASEAVSRLHRIKPGKAVFIQQHPDAIDAGAFHNDVLAVSNCDMLLYHEAAFRDWREMEENITSACNFPIHFIRATEAEIDLSEAISTYLFNSQLISRSGWRDDHSCPCGMPGVPAGGCFSGAHSGERRQSGWARGIREFAAKHEKRRRAGVLAPARGADRGPVRGGATDQPRHSRSASLRSAESLDRTALSRAHPARGRRGPIPVEREPDSAG